MFTGLNSFARIIYLSHRILFYMLTLTTFSVHYLSYIKYIYM